MPGEEQNNNLQRPQNTPQQQRGPVQNNIIMQPRQITVTEYRPKEIIDIFNQALSRQNVHATPIYLRGLYSKGKDTEYNGRYYDKLKDENGIEEITIIVSRQQRENLANGNLVSLRGTLGRSCSKEGYINLAFNVSDVEIVQNQVIDEDEQKRLELRLKKVEKGFKNVDSILENLIYDDKKPKVALLFAASSITFNDFKNGAGSAASHIVFEERRVTFTQTENLCNTIKALDTQGFDVIAIVRGGGVEPKNEIDKPKVVETVVNLNTPVIVATGHADEKIFLRQVADKWTATPQGLGQFFSELVENAIEKKTRSRAVLTEQIKKQFKEQLEKLEKQNKETQEKFNKLSKQQEEAQKTHKEQIEAANKQNTKLQEQLKTINKTHDEQIKKLGESHKTELSKLAETHKTQLGELNKTLTKQQEENNKRQTELNNSIKEMQKTNGELQKSLSQLNAQNTQAQKDLNAAKDKARELERQLEEARRKTGKGCLGKFAAVAAAFLIFLGLLF